MVLWRSIQTRLLFCLLKQTRAASEKELKIPPVIVVSGGFCIMQGEAVLIGKAGSVFPLGIQWALIESNSHFICLVLLMKTKRGNSQWQHEMRWKLRLFWGKSALKLVFRVQDVNCYCFRVFVVLFQHRVYYPAPALDWCTEKSFIKLSLCSEIIFLYICLCFLLNIYIRILNYFIGAFSGRHINTSIYTMSDLHIVFLLTF